jgi:hypothetical protein
LNSDFNAEPDPAVDYDTDPEPDLLPKMMQILANPEPQCGKENTY